MSSISVTSDIVQLPNGFYKLAIQTTGTDISSYVFAIEVLPTSRDPLAVPYRFSHVCKLTDLIELPAEQNPNEAYFRTNDIEMVFDTVDLAVATNKVIQNDIKQLVATYNALNEPSISGTTTIIGG